MGISEKKMKIVIDNYFHSECNVNTSIRSAFEKGFRIGVGKGLSAQPEQQSFSCGQENDMISRQAAIDALDCINGTEEVLRSLPSAQSERTCLNCGRTANNGGWYADGRTRCPIEEHYALPKDGFCHLWEKRNITDDDYPRRNR